MCALSHFTLESSCLPAFQYSLHLANTISPRGFDAHALTQTLSNKICLTLVQLIGLRPKCEQNHVMHSIIKLPQWRFLSIAGERNTSVFLVETWCGSGGTEQNTSWLLFNLMMSPARPTWACCWLRCLSLFVNVFLTTRSL